MSYFLEIHVEVYEKKKKTTYDWVTAWKNQISKVGTFFNNFEKIFKLESLLEKLWFVVK